jgi:hypothetical protein
MPRHGKFSLICARATLACGVVGLAVLAKGSLHAAECLDRFPEGRFGVPLSHLAVVTGQLAVTGFAPLYLTKQPVHVAEKETCDYVYPGDIFRVVESRPTGALLAGCMGDFEGDGRIAFALLMKRHRDGAVLPMVFRSRANRYEATPIDGIVDPYGFDEDRSIWPGPMCLAKPPNGVFESEVGGKIAVVGDLFVIGWKTYFWNPSSKRFDAILTSD